MITIDLYLIIINILSLILMGYDKVQAIKNKTRISEKNLLLIAILGGSIGTLIGMLLFKHKIRKIKFIFLIPTVLIIDTLIYFYIN